MVSRYINIDEAGLIKQVSDTAGHIHDSKELEKLLEFKDGKSVGKCMQIVLMQIGRMMRSWGQRITKSCIEPIGTSL